MILESVPKEAEQIVQLPYEDIEPEYPKFAFRRPKIKCIDPDEQSNNVKTKDNDQTKKIKKNQSKK